MDLIWLVWNGRSRSEDDPSTLRSSGREQQHGMFSLILVQKMVHEASLRSHRGLSIASVVLIS